MLRWRTPHPDLEDLIRYSDGELPKRTANRVGRHVQDCWECRSELEDSGSIVRQYMQYHKHVLQAEMPPPPNPWYDVRRGFAEALTTQAEATWLPPFLHRMLARPAMLLLAGGSLLASAVIALSVLVHAPTSDVDQLLNKGMIFERAANMSARIELRTKSSVYTRAARTEESAALPGIDETVQPLATLFTKANFSWDKPLSAESFAEWRRSLFQKGDEVTSVRRGTVVERYEIRTSASGNAIRQATIALDGADFRTIMETLEFWSGETITIRPIADAGRPTLPLQTGNSRLPKKPDRPAVAAPASLPPASAEIGPGEEIRVFVALHSIGADLGDPIQISRDNHQILVSGAGLSASRQKQIQDSLGSLPHVVVQFPPEQRGTLAPSTPLSVVTESPIRSELEVALERRIGSREEAQHLIDAVLRDGEALMVRAYAVRRLAEHFPVNIESTMSSLDRELLTTLVEEEESALLSHVNAIANAIGPSLETVGARIPQPEASTTARGWQSEAQGVFTSARTLDQQLSQLFGHTTPVSSTAAYELGTALGRLKTSLARYSSIREKR